MFALRRRVVSRASIAAASAVRFQSGRRGPPPPGQGQGQGRGMTREQMQQQEEQIRMMQQQQQMQQGMPEDEGEAPPPPQKPENSRYTKVEHRPDGTVIVRMARAPVNSLNLDFFTELADWFMWLGSGDETCKQIVLTSELATVFSAGIDIAELHKPEPERFQNFWMSFQELWLILNSFPKPVIAAINGNAPAGGCILSMCCDFRVMARASLKDPANPKPYRIGLNETKLGIIAPPWVMKSLAYTVGDRKAERMLQLGETPTADEALAIGLVDRVVEENEVLEVALQEAARFGAIAPEARWMSKDMMRRDLMQFFPSEKEREYDAQFFGELVQSPDVAASIEKYLERLRGGKPAKK